MKARISAAILGAAALPILAAPTFAAGPEEPMVEPAPVAVPAPSAPVWAGFYGGAQLGWGWADTDTSADADEDNDGVLDTIDDSIDKTVDAVESIGEDGDGAIGGFHLGWLGQANRLVYGVEGDYDFADIQLDDDAGEIDRIGRIKARAGYDFGRTLLYAAGGAAYSEAEIGRADFDDWGWALGAGVDYLITDAVSVGTEVLYHDFGEFDDSDTDVSITTLTARVAYRF